MKILISGGGGFIAIAAARDLLNADHTVVLTDRLVDSEPIRVLSDQFGERLIVEKLDVTVADDVEAAVAHHAPDAVIALAAVMGEEVEPDGALLRTRVNIDGTLYLLHAAAAAGISRVVVSSSIAVLGADGLYERDQLPLDESATPIPNPHHYLYSYGKLYVEAVARWYFEHTALDVRVLRPSTVYGPGRITGLAFVSDMISDAISGRRGEDIPNVVLNMIYVDDIGKQFAELATLPAAQLGDTRLFNSGGDRATMADVARIVESVVPGSSLLERVFDVPADFWGGTDFDLPSTVDGQAIDKAVGHERPHSPLEKGIGAFAEWQQQNTAS